MGGRTIGPFRAARWLILVIGIFGAGLIMPKQGQAVLVDRIVAVVNEEIILQSELEQRLIPLKEVLKQKEYSPEEKSRVFENQSKLMLDQMIYDKLADQQARKYRIEISEQEVTATIARIRSINKLTEESMQRMLELDGMTMETYRTQIKEKLLRTRLVNLEVKSKIVITDEDVQTYYDAHRDRYLGKTKYKLRHLLLRVSPMASDMEQAKVLQRAQALKQRLQAGESFPELAETFSEASSAAKGGELGVFGINLLTEKVQSAIQGLGAGSVTEVVETEQGYQIFYIEDIISSDGKVLDDARQEIQETLYAQDVDRKYKAWLKRMRESAHVEILE
jgi:peptidyl-prolyl cis-trans isomerase SurA